MIDFIVLKDKFEMLCLENFMGRFDLLGVDVFVFMVDLEKELLFMIGNIILFIFVFEYLLEKLVIYFFDDGGVFLLFEVLVEVVSFVCVWVLFCRKYKIEFCNFEMYFFLKGDFIKGKIMLDFVKDWCRVKCEYDEFKVCVNGLLDVICCRLEVYNVYEEI